MAVSTSGHPGGMFDGEGSGMELSFTAAPADGAEVDFETLGFWGNSGAFDNTTIALTYQLAEGTPVPVGTKKLRNLSSPRTKGEYYSFPLSGLNGVKDPVTFTLSADRKGQRVILKIDDLRLDGAIR